jgi:hypothetical protein
MNRSTLPLIVIVLVVVAGLFLWSRVYRNDIPLPAAGIGTTSTDTITTEDGPKEILVTDGVKHSIPLREIRSGGPPKDGIPPIDDPKFISIDDAGGWLGDEEPGIAVSRGDTHRFYPYQILVWHEIVNDHIEGERFLVTYCPLCLTGIVFDPVVKGERVAFGTSGKLWESNLVMYDRKTDSYWSQVLGEAIVGEMTGTKLDVLPSDLVRFGAWKAMHQNGQVLSQNTGATRLYGSSPYGGYFNVTGFAYAMASTKDERMSRDTFVFGIEIDDETKAYATDLIQERGEAVDEFAGKTIVLRYDAELEVSRMFERRSDGTEKRINPISGFWFSWVTAHPDTEVWE